MLRYKFPTLYLQKLATEKLGIFCKSLELFAENLVSFQDRGAHSVPSFCGLPLQFNRRYCLRADPRVRNHAHAVARRTYLLCCAVYAFYNRYTLCCFALLAVMASYMLLVGSTLWLILKSKRIFFAVRACGPIPALANVIASMAPLQYMCAWQRSCDAALHAEGGSCLCVPRTRGTSCGDDL